MVKHFLQLIMSQKGIKGKEECSHSQAFTDIGVINTNNINIFMNSVKENLLQHVIHSISARSLRLSLEKGFLFWVKILAGSTIQHIFSRVEHGNTDITMDNFSG